MNESSSTPPEPNGLEPLPGGSLPSRSSWAANHGRAIVQLISIAAIWDLARLDKVPGTHALIAFGAIAAPALTAWLLSKRIQK